MSNINEDLIPDEEFYEIIKNQPWDSAMAFAVRDGFGIDFVKSCGYNFEPVIAKFGEEWYNIPTLDAAMMD